MSAIRSSPPPAVCKSTSSRSIKKTSARFRMQNLVGNPQILKYMECKEFHLTFWQLIMEKKMMRHQLKLPRWKFYQPSYNPAVPIPPAGWPVAPRPQPWYPQHSAVSVPPSAPLGLPPQPLFPVQNLRPPLPPTAPPGLQASVPVVPPGLPAPPPIPVSQPLFPVVPSSNVPAQNSAFSAPMLPTSLPLSTLTETKNSVDGYLNNNASVTNTFATPGIPAAMPVNSHSYASGPNTGGPSIGPPPVIANKAPASQPAGNEVYLVWDDEAMSMEERRMSLLKYQVHDETSQMSSIDAAIDRRISESRLAGRMAF
ncbi:protein SUPPRESSOR OF FRI 4-like isoform X2 [Coffea arabica]|uniref:Protein SUPPRESSOR OF FRI 4-like isoform X2 n=1 Tax=Coffea arabica TaxID=13443 RepID=A0A6P6UDP1_COFAR|nr:protein SUPPRESSOR OF FRI 4-like isoform X2 [Coffea arabica]